MVLRQFHPPTSGPVLPENTACLVTGTAAGPMDIVDSIVMGKAAAAEAAAYLETWGSDCLCISHQ